MLNRREALIVGAGLLLSSSVLRNALTSSPYREVFAGWLDLKEAREQFKALSPRPYLRDYNSPIKGTGKNRQISLIKHYERVTNAPFAPAFQTIGDCCGQAAVMGAQVLSTTQIDLQKKNEEWKGPFSVEFTYASSRVEIGGSRMRPGSDGSSGAWVARSMQEIGLLLRGKYGQYDLSKYRPDLGRAWGRNGVGVPDELEPIAKQHPIKTVALVKTWAEACDCIANGFPVILASNIGYWPVCDRDGFLLHYRVKWNHAMLLAGIDTVSRREGGLIVNSWGPDWISGPDHKLGRPAGCFWADAANIQLALAQEDSFALSNFVGFPRRNLNYELY